MGKKKIQFYQMLRSLEEGELLATQDKKLVIEKVDSKVIREAVGGGYGEYLNEPHTVGAYLVRETLNVGPNPVWKIETTIPKALRKLNWVKHNVKSFSEY